jgi:malonyl-CoA/methylmalonyl-CoA synthetase
VLEQHALDLGERVAAWIVAAPGRHASEREPADYVARQLSPAKRPRVVHNVDALPRNNMGKVVKEALTA